MTNYDKLSDRAKQIYGNVEEAMQDAEELGGVSGEDYLNLMQEIIDEATKRYHNHDRLMDESLQERY
jgi:DNA-binding ferritin-like protein (Dps family)